jgi:S1-C subfamily serine protease
MNRLWTDGPPTQTIDPPRPRQPIVEPPYNPPPAPPAPPAPSGGRGPSRWLAAVGGGTVSAVVVSAVLLGTGIGGGDDNAPASSAGTSAQPAVINASDAKGDLVRTIYAAASPSVVSVRTESGSGTGFLVDSDGTIVTNAHVVGQSSQVKVRFEDNGDLHDAQVLGVDASTDLAAIKVDGAPDGVRPLELANSDDVQVGDTAVAIGYPLGLDRTATAGIISGLQRKIESPNGFAIDKVIQTDAPVNPGNSGGPLLNANGKVVGVNSQIATAGGGQGNVGIAFAIPANTVKDILPQLATGKAPEHAYLGLSMGEAPNGGVQIGDATPGGPAADAGLQQGDVVTKVDGQDVQTPDDVSAAIEDNKPGDRVEVTVQRNGSEETVQVTLGQRPEQVPSQTETPETAPGTP